MVHDGACVYVCMIVYMCVRVFMRVCDSRLRVVFDDAALAKFKLSKNLDGGVQELPYTLITMIKWTTGARVMIIFGRTSLARKRARYARRGNMKS